MLQKYLSYQFSCNWFATLFLSSLSYWQVVNWLEGPGSEQLRTQWGIGDSIRASQALQQKHEEIESQHSVRFSILFSSSKIILNTSWAVYFDDEYPGILHNAWFCVLQMKVPEQF